MHQLLRGIIRMLRVDIKAVDNVKFKAFQCKENVLSNE
jgi:hypothetical protein